MATLGITQNDKIKQEKNSEREEKKCKANKKEKNT
jgi:hypothetical protein